MRIASLGWSICSGLLLTSRNSVFTKPTYHSACWMSRLASLPFPRYEVVCIGLIGDVGIAMRGDSTGNFNGPAGIAYFCGVFGGFHAG
ncbi:hypothetical protein CPB85DRAFT_1331943 [Mucidula mucida]|nr:hypothetical protein CPB85DRAFT_1331943 [Mucidula mucida]